jgi:hypothetical protein
MRDIIPDPTPFVSVQEAAEHEAEELIKEVRK